MLDAMRAAIVVLATLVLVGLVGVATTMFRPASDSDPLKPIIVEVPADVSPRAPSVTDVYPADERPAPAPADSAPGTIPDARTQTPPPLSADVPPPPPPVVGDDDDFDDDDFDDGDDDFDD